MFKILTPLQRLYQVEHPILALTGGIGTGKSTVAALLEKKGFPVIAADQLVKNIYAKKSSKEFVAEHFPDCITEGEINFRELRSKVFSVPENKAKIEGFIYPQMQQAFLDDLAKKPKHLAVIYDVPLLFERKLDSMVDFIILAYADQETQVKRVMERDKVDHDLALKIIKSQMDIEEKKKKSHYIVDNSRGLIELESEVSLLSSKLLAFLSKP